MQAPFSHRAQTLALSLHLCRAVIMTGRPVKEEKQTTARSLVVKDLKTPSAHTSAKVSHPNLAIPIPIPPQKKEEIRIQSPRQTKYTPS